MTLILLLIVAELAIGGMIDETFDGRQPLHILEHSPD